MESRETAAVRYRIKIGHARQVERVLQWLGWTVLDPVGGDRLTNCRIPTSPGPANSAAPPRRCR